MPVPAVSPACRRARWLCLTAFVVACDAGDHGGGAQRSVPGAPLEIEANPALSVGVVEGDVDQQFDRVVTPFLLPDGRLVVPVAGSSSIRIFAAKGEFVTGLGRTGEGPGEFQGLIAAWPRGDTIEALDDALRRITRFYPDGSVDVVTLQSDIPDFSAAAGPVPDGWMVGGVASGASGRRDDVVVQRFDLSGAWQGDVGRVAGFARYRAPDLSGPEPLSPRGVIAVARGRAWLAETLTPRIEVRATAGTVEREIVWQPDRVFDVSETLGEVIDSAVARAGPDQAQRIRQRLEAAPVPERISVFWKFLVDDEGFLWIREYEPRLHAAALGGLAPGGVGQGGRWQVLSGEGEPVASIDVPPELEPLRITSDAVVGISRDALGVERVHVHRLRRSS